jgi:predicted AlkP superfamily phosphohydrolase/phosphomutase
MVISDHGFNTFRYGVDLNRWLEENGYLKVRSEKRDQKNLVAVDWSQTRAYALGLAGIYLNLKGREAQGIVDPGDEATRLRREIADKLRVLTDLERGQPAIKQVYNALEVYRGPYKDEAPDLIVGYNRGYRASWETAIGQVTDRVFHDNTKAWSGDHCIDHSLVPGVLFCNRPVAAERPRLIDIAPTVLDMFGVEVPNYMDGRPLGIADGLRHRTDSLEREQRENSKRTKK